MMRVRYLPSDFNPMILMLGEAEDCRALGGVFRRYVRDRADVILASLNFCHVAGCGVVVTAAPGAVGVSQHSDERFIWRVPADQAADFAERLDDLGDPGRLAGSERLDCGSLDGIAVIVSRGEYADDFLTDAARRRDA